MGLIVSILVIPGLSGNKGELADIARYGKSVDADVPWHVSAYFPADQLLDAPRPRWPPFGAREIGLQAGLRYVYEGNVPGEAGENTYCHRCGATVIRRSGMGLVWNRLHGGKCLKCSKTIDGVSCEK